MEKNIYTYIEIKSYENGEVVKRMDVSGKSDRTITTIDNGINRNLNHEQYYTFVFERDTKLDII